MSGIPTSQEIAAMMRPAPRHCELCGKRWRLYWYPADEMFAHTRCRKAWLSRMVEGVEEGTVSPPSARTS